jgi:uncharacterized protein YwgA
MTTPDAVKAILDCSGGTLVGRTRFQKSAYFLEAAGVGYGFDFSYHYYGPYSEELAVAVTDAEALGLIHTDWDTSQAGFTYAIYHAVPPKKPEESDLNHRRKEILAILDGYDAISLELAATAHYLTHNGYAHDPWEETRRRKTVKATTERVAKAQRLLAELRL